MDTTYLYKINQRVITPYGSGFIVERDYFVLPCHVEATVNYRVAHDNVYGEGHPRTYTVTTKWYQEDYLRTGSYEDY